MHDHEHAKAASETGFWGRRGAGCVIMARNTGYFLIAHRAPGVMEPNTWGTWGGAIDSNEDPVEAVKREVREETGYTGRVTVESLHVFEKGSFRYFNFLVIVDKEFEPSLNWENQGSKWCTWGDWPEPLHFGLKDLLTDLESARKMQTAAKTG